MMRNYTQQPNFDTNNALNWSKAKGKRLKRVRNLANLSCKEICQHSGININSLKGWEIGRNNGLTLKGAEKIVKRIQQAGIIRNLHN